MKMNWVEIFKDALGWISKILVIVLPWFWKAVETFGAILVLVEKANTADKKKEAVDAFEQYLIKSGYISEGTEKTFDPIIDWLLGWIVDIIIEYLNKHYGHDWINKFKK